MATSSPRLPLHERPYRPCVGILLVNNLGLVFSGQRRDRQAWQMPQGGIEEGETPIQAAQRELKEEVGTDKAEILGEMQEWLSYEFPLYVADSAYEGRYRGQRQKWVAMRFKGQETDININTPVPEFQDWRWATRAELLDLIAPFKRKTYEAVLQAFAYLWE